MDLYQLLVQPLSYEFMQRAMLAALLIGAISGVVGCFIVVRGMSFFGEALGHSILPGVAVAYILKADLFVGGLVAGIGTALGIGAGVMTLAATTGSLPTWQFIAGVAGLAVLLMLVTSTPIATYAAFRDPLRILRVP